MELATPDTKGKKEWNYRNRKACKDCPIKARCTNSKYRTIKRSVNDKYLEANRERLSQNKEIRKQRKAIVEPPFSWLKLHSLIGGFLTKGFAMVNAEFSLAQIAFNMKRVATIKKGDLNNALTDLILLMADYMKPHKASLSQYKAA